MNDHVFRLFDQNPSALFDGLANTPQFKAIAWLFLAIAGGFLAVGTILRLKRANTTDEKQDVWTLTLLLIAFIFIGPSFMRGLRDMSWYAQRDMGMSTTQVSYKCLMLAGSMPEMDKVFDSIVARANKLATPAAGAQQGQNLNRVSQWFLDTVGSNAVGSFLATLAEMPSVGANQVENVFTSVQNLGEFLKLMYELIGTLLRSMVKFIFMMVLFVVITIVMLLVSAVAFFMEVLQQFLMIFGAMLLPMFIAFFAVRGFEGAARNYCIHMFCISTWNIVWAMGSFGIVALFNVACNAFCAMFGLTADRISWDANEAKFAEFGRLIHSSYDGSLTVNQAADVAGQIHQAIIMGPLISLLTPLLAVVAMCVWAFYVYVRLPFVYVQLVQTGADMVGQVATQAFTSSAKMVSEAAQTAVLAGATIATGGAAAPAAAAAGGGGAAAGGAAGGAAAGGGGGRFMSALGEGLTGASPHGSWMNVAGQVSRIMGGRGKHGNDGGGRGSDSASPAQQAAQQAAEELT